ncbi:hypothetical protein SDC9_102718 [bioreactor metagenome]|uniref:Type II secretion system protein M n=1 Tax=bioreactor metagenome TaxID=1076179 RepID=A0A645AS44_9ZZZZ
MSTATTTTTAGNNKKARGQHAETLDMLKTRWKALAAREQILVLAASAIVLLALVWWVALAPALKTLRAAPAEHAQLDSQLQHMRSLQQEALELQKAPRVQGEDAAKVLQTSLTQALGATAQVAVVGDRATVTLKAAPAAALGQWLSQVRSNVRAVPIQAKLVRSGASSGNKPATDNPPAHWDGTLVLSLPPAN